ncbi:MAG TPA: hypothetical protein VGO76_13285 [Luteibacter sp.]|jgi:hypothetical protein|nr:hypothetical protein [Luteibacter sp.]
MRTARSDLATVVAIAVVAYAACDMTHEALGHGVAALFTGLPVVSLSTVALSTTGSSRLVAAAGPLINIVVGLLGLYVFRKGAGFGTSRYFLWLFATLNLLNGTGYLAYSGMLHSGDWSVVFAGMTPHVGWRIGMVVTGIATYFGSVYAAARAWVPLVQQGDIARNDMHRLVLPAYMAGGLLLVAGAALNPLPQLILLSGVSSGFGAMAGLLLVPEIVERNTPNDKVTDNRLTMSHAWIVAGLIVMALFIAVIGPGIHSVR